MANVQQHIHLGLTLTGSPEFAPAFKWAVTFPNYQRKPNVVVGLKRGLTGKLRTHRLQNAGVAIKFLDRTMVIRVTAEQSETFEQRVADIEAMNGETVYFTPITHADDGTDHSADTKLMFLRILSTGKPYTPSITRYDYEIELTDNNTV